MKIKHIIAVLFLTVPVTHAVYAQNTAPMEVPKWVTMMEDPNVNLIEAVKEYESFWATRKKPKKEAEIFDALNGKGRETGKTLEELEAERLANLGPKLEGKELEQLEYLKYQSKRFEKWVLEVKPWVQEDGHILTYEERQAIWNKQQEEIRQQQNKK
ncbi:MAG: hypothetical protein ACK5DJ_03890 [Bacteroidota bacterium]|jgi:hypothetical protein